MELPNFYRYIAIFNYYEGGISITFPDLPSCVSHGENDDDAIKSAKEVLMLHIYGMETDGENIPIPSNLKAIQPELFADDIPVVIEIFMPAFREKQHSRFIKKTLSIPKWLNTYAENAGINFSQTLQESLKAKLHLD